MAMAPERSNPLHNFSLPCLKWGNQRFLRCMKVPPNSQSSSLRPRSSLESHQSKPKPKSKYKPDIPYLYALNPIRNPKPTSNTHKAVTIRQNLMLDLGMPTKSKKLRLSVSEGEDRNSGPWNLRTRRAACTAPKEDRKIELGSSSPTKGECTVGANAEAKENVKLAVSLLKEEVAEDFLKMVGARPPRRPKKRTRIVQKQLDSIFPGLWLTEVTLDSY